MRFVRLVGIVLLGAILIAASTALAGYLMWELLLFLIHQSQK